MRKAAKVIACVNHDVNAIASHQANHPECLHFTEDIRTLDLTELITVVRHAKTLHSDVGMLFIDLFCGAGGVTTGIEHADIFKGLEIESFSDKPLLCLWASLECTNFSKAKGGLPRDADSRTLANHLFRYMDACPFDLIFIENVEEFMAWGPLDENGKPLSKDRGFDYVNWISRMKAHSGGYNFEHRILNAADYGAHTSRRRYFGIFVRPGITIQFPKPTHSKKGTNGLQKWRAVKEVLDFSDEGESIFTRKKPLSERTLERIYAGLIKYVANGDASFIQKYYSGNPSNFVHSIDTTIGTITTIDHHSLVQPKFLAYYYGKHTLSDTNSPCGTLRTKDTAQLIQPKFWIDRQYGQGGGKTSSIDEPIGSLPTVPKANMASAWVLSPHFNNKGTSIEDPAPVITANRKHHYLMFPQWGVNCSYSVNKPSPVLPARMDKMAPYLIISDACEQPFGIALFEDDSVILQKIKIFMTAYGIVDIKMRMLRIKELKMITGFDENYTLIGTQQEQKKYIGNAVPVLLARAIIEAQASAVLGPIENQIRKTA